MRQIRYFSAALSALVIMGASLSTNAMVVHDFSTDAQGWHVLTYDNPGTFQSDDGIAPYDANFGNPSPAGNGSISATDPGDDLAARWGAPASIIAALEIGGSISFDIIIKANPGDSSLPAVPGLLLIEGAGKSLGYTGALPTATGWTTYNISLNANALATQQIGFWANIDPTDPSNLNTPASAGDFIDVFAGITRVSITGEVTNGTDDTLALDNVVVTAPVPVPAALPLFLSAMAAFGFLARRRG